MGWLADACALWTLARQRSRSLADYDRFQRFMAGQVQRHLERHGVSLPGLRLLDVGAAWGAYGQAFAEAGADVTCLDLTVDQYIPAERRRAFVAGDAARLPLADGGFDFVFCASLIEHEPDASTLLAELYRVLRPGGQGYVGFPPFYSPLGGHQFKPFHLLGERTAVRLAGGGVTSYATSHARGGLYRRTIHGVRRLLEQAGFEIRDVSTRFTALNVARLPWLGELLTWYVQFLVCRPAGGGTMGTTSAQAPGTWDRANTGAGLMQLIRRALTGYFYAIYRDMVDRLLRAEVEMMEPCGNGLHLDLGSHAGENAARLAAAAGLTPIWGIEYDPDLLRQGLQRGVRGIQADLNCELPLRSAAFDVVTAMDVIEHLSRTDIFLSEIYRVLRPGGYVVIATPNLAAWHNVFALILGLQPFSGPSVTDMTDGEIDLVRRLHRRAYDMPEEGEATRPQDAETVHRHLVVLAYRSLINALERHGFRIEAARGYGYYPLPPFLARLTAKLDIWHSVHVLVKVRKPAEGGDER